MDLVPASVPLGSLDAEDEVGDVLVELSTPTVEVVLMTSEVLPRSTVPYALHARSLVSPGQCTSMTQGQVP